MFGVQFCYTMRVGIPFSMQGLNGRRYIFFHHEAFQ